MADRPVLPRLLDLFCGAGGAAMGYARAGFEVVGVDIKPQPHYPFEFIEGDALEFLHYWLTEPGPHFDAIHASPPCQAYTHAKHIANRGRADHPRLIEPTRELLLAAGVPFVIENVVHAPLVSPLVMCGTAMGLAVKRHRLFESNVLLLAPPCACGMHLPQRFPSTPRVELGFRDEDGPRPLSRYVNPLASGTTHELFSQALGIDWIPKRGHRPAAELHEAVPPVYTERIGKQLIQALAAPPVGEGA
jgi:DNA (cytosine-5)-methyltransferase 1